MKKIICIAATGVLLPAMAFAAVSKIALLMGNNRGEPQEVELLYTHRDVEKLAATLKTYGGFQAQDVTVLLEGDSKDAMDALSAISDKIRRQARSGHSQILLFVYFSGHADADHLHMGDSKLAFKELKKLIEACPAKFRVVVLDSCKSGMLTRAKGGMPIKRFELAFQNQLESRGTALITSSAHDEDSQESDQYKGSLFTHHFNSGLLGAADESGDGKISLFEAYAYAYEQTIKTTSQTSSGTQHPTYKFDMHGKGEITITDLSAKRLIKSSLVFPWAGEFLVFKNDEHGEIVAELVSTKSGGRLVLEPGDYFIRERKAKEYLQGSMTLGAGNEHSLTDWKPERVAYTRMVRKMSFDLDPSLRIAHGPSVGYRYRTRIQEDMEAMHMFGLGYPLRFRWFSVNPELRMGRLQVSSEEQNRTVFEFDLLFQATATKDTSYVGFSAGILLGGGYITVHDTTDPQNDYRQHHFGLILGGLGAVKVDLPWDFYLQAGVELLSYWMKRETLKKEDRFVTPMAFSVGLTLGKMF